MQKFVWQHRNWTQRLTWQADALIGALARTRRKQGELLGRASQLGLEAGAELQLDIVTEDALTTAAIEGDVLDRRRVRSSVARRLGLSTAGLPKPDRGTDGLVEVLLDATRNHAEPLTARRLCGWQAALFPTGWSGLHEIEVGRWRSGGEPMQVVSGRIGREHVHFEAPPSRRLEREMILFLSWFNEPFGDLDGLLRAGIAHFRFVTIHPFDDGNGRIARAVGDMALAQDEGSDVRLYSVSRQIAAERNAYYTVLERTQRGTGDLTEWLGWFLGVVERGVSLALQELDLALTKGRFWSTQAAHGWNARQVKALNRLLDAGPGGFEGGLTTAKYVSLTRTSRATAQREIAELVDAGLLRRREGGGRSTSYELVLPG